VSCTSIKMLFISDSAYRMVRKAARRGCAFGFAVPQEYEEGKTKDAKSQAAQERRKCEAVMKGAVVEASYAKGEWAIRWREKA
jgi:hypothetical protein